MRPLLKRSPHKVIAALAWAVLLGTASAAYGQVEVRPASSTSAAVDDIRSELALAFADIETDGQRIRVTVGPSAFREALREDAETPLVGTFLTSVEYQEILGAGPRPKHITAVFSDPDPQDQLRLARALLGNSRVGAYASPATQTLVERLSGVDGFIALDATGRDTSALIRGAEGLKALLVLPDPAVVNRGNINQIVRAFYQRQQVLIGYSETLTRIGALASVYPSRTATTTDAVERVRGYLVHGEMSAPRYVEDITVSINTRLARSLNIAVPDLETLTRSVSDRGTP